MRNTWRLADAQGDQLEYRRAWHSEVTDDPLYDQCHYLTSCELYDLLQDQGTYSATSSLRIVCTADVTERSRVDALGLCGQKGRGRTQCVPCVSSPSIRRIRAMCRQSICAHASRFFSLAASHQHTGSPGARSGAARRRSAMELLPERTGGGFHSRWLPSPSAQPHGES
jgi:hypothetical protein